MEHKNHNKSYLHVKKELIIDETARLHEHELSIWQRKTGGYGRLTRRMGLQSVGTARSFGS